MAFDEAAGKFENKMHRERKNCHVATRCEKLDVNRQNYLQYVSVA